MKPGSNGFVAPAQFNRALETVVGLVIDHLNQVEEPPDQAFALGLITAALAEMREKEDA